MEHQELRDQGPGSHRSGGEGDSASHMSEGGSTTQRSELSDAPESEISTPREFIPTEGSRRLGGCCVLHVDLQSNYIGDSSLPALARLLRRTATLRSLNLRVRCARASH